jgi:hypothetical protein
LDPPALGAEETSVNFQPSTSLHDQFGGRNYFDLPADALEAGITKWPPKPTIE